MQRKRLQRRLLKILKRRMFLILQWNIYLKGNILQVYPRTKKRSIRIKAASIVVEAGEVFLKKKVLKLFYVPVTASAKLGSYKPVYNFQYAKYNT